MKNTLIDNDNIFLASPLEVIEIEPEDFQQATEISRQITDEALRWQTYQNGLGLIGFENWLKQRKPELHIDKSQCSILQRQLVTIDAVCHLQVNHLMIDLININDLNDELVTVKKNVVDSPDFASHFYVLTEVLEEQAQVTISGFVRYDKLNNYRSSENLSTPQDEYYQVPLSLFNAELNQLLVYLSFLAPTAIPLPVKEASDKVSQSIINLTHWLNGTFDVGWQTLENLLNPSQAALAFRFRDGNRQKNNTSDNSSFALKRGKLLNLRVEEADESVVLLIGLMLAEAQKIKVSVEVYPTKSQTYLPPDLQLIVLDETGYSIMQAQTRNTNKDIYLDFTANPREQFSIKIVLNTISMTEHFVV
jgi:hypothetical protein